MPAVAAVSDANNMNAHSSPAFQFNLAARVADLVLDSPKFNQLNLADEGLITAESSV